MFIMLVNIDCENSHNKMKLTSAYSSSPLFNCVSLTASYPSSTSLTSSAQPPINSMAEERIRMFQIRIHLQCRINTGKERGSGNRGKEGWARWEDSGGMGWEAHEGGVTRIRNDH